MKKYTAVLVDDEEASNQVLAHFLENFCTDVEVVSMCDTLQDAYTAVKKHEPHILFLDISLGANEDAFQLLDIIGKNDTKVIFVTAFTDYAVKAFEYAATDYLVKPLKINDLVRAVSRAISAINETSPEPQQEEEIIVRTKERLIFVKKKDISFIEAYGKVSVVHLIEGTKIDSIQLLLQFQELLSNPPFFRVHKSFIVNLDHVKSIIKKGGMNLELSNSYVLPVSKLKRLEVEGLLGID